MRTHSHRFTERTGAAALAVCCLGLLVAFAPLAVSGWDESPQRIVEPTGYAPARKSRETERGRKLFAKLQCAQCHAINGVGGKGGPPLDGVGGRRTAAFLKFQLSDPTRFALDHPDLKGWELSYMPHPQATPREVRSLVAYLLTLPEPKGGFAVGSHRTEVEPELDRPVDSGWTPNRPSDLSRRGQRLYYNSGCASCHSIARFGGSFGPHLDGIGMRHSRPFIEAHISNPVLHARKAPTAFPDGSIMPSIELSPDDKGAIVEFLLTLPSFDNRSNDASAGK